jgi:hypothetical protein
MISEDIFIGTHIGCMICTIIVNTSVSMSCIILYSCVGKINNDILTTLIKNCSVWSTVQSDNGLKNLGRSLKKLQMLRIDF